MKLNRYPKYKPTGIVWLPEVPEGWEMVRVGRVYADVSERGEVSLPILSVSISSGVSDKQLDDDELARKVVRSEDKLLYKHVSVGDLAYNQMRAWQGAFGTVKVEGLVSPAYVVCRPRDAICSSYIEYLLKTPMMVQEMKRRSTGIVDFRLRLYWSQFKAMPLVFPPLPTQRAIVAYLDEKCGKVDRLVAAKEKEAALLKELKQSMIAEAVTGATQVARTDAARKMKSSGIPWLPEVPEGWEVKRVATLLKIKDCPSAPNEELLSVFLDRGVIRFSEGGEKRANATSKDLSKYQLVEVDDFVMNNQQAWRGSVGISRYRGIVSPAYFVVRLADCIDSKYAEYAFRSRSFVSVYELCSRGVGSIQRNLIWNVFKQQHLPLPPLAEQREIVAHIEARAAKIDAAVKGLEREVAALKEYKQRLIADVVTGQRKVA